MEKYTYIYLVEIKHEDGQKTVYPYRTMQSAIRFVYAGFDIERITYDREHNKLFSSKIKDIKWISIERTLLFG